MTQDEKRELAQRACDALNAAFKSDPRAMHALSVNRVPCTQELADDPHIVVDKAPVLPDGCGYSVGMIGVLVGMFSAMGFPCTPAVSMGDPVDEEGRRKFSGFSLIDFAKCQPERAIES